MTSKFKHTIQNITSTEPQYLQEKCTTKGRIAKAAFSFRRP